MIKKNIQTTTIYIFLCVVWVLTVSKYIDIRLKLQEAELQVFPFVRIQRS
jgi:hypothetical protein